MSVVAITAIERAAFKRCRRAWDLGARLRRGLEPADAPTASSAASDQHPAREALAVHYYPGMWEWDRSIVAPLVRKAAGEAAPYVERYVAWAADIDDFEPVRVEFDFDARIPDPSRGGDLVAPDGRAVHYQGRIHALVVDDRRRHWLLVHRFGPWTDPAVLRLDEDAVIAAWAWERTYLDRHVDGILYNELSAEGEFRRTRRRLTSPAIAAAATQLCAEVVEMLDPGLVVYPTPGEHCPTCPFLEPCTTMQDGADADGLLATRFRPRPPEPLLEGRLGGETWGVGRGAMPPRFRDDDR